MKSTHSSRTEGDATATPTSVLLIETMRPDDPTLVFDTDRTREFSAAGRLQHHRDPDLTRALRELVADVVRTRESDVRPIKLHSGRYLAAAATPKFGPDPEVVFAVQVVLADPDTMPIERPVRTVGTLEWSSKTNLYHHDPIIETEIMGVDDPKATRSTQEVYKLFETMPKFLELGKWASDFMADPEGMDGDTFTADLRMKQVDGKTYLDTFMTFRALAQVKGVPVIRGLVHNISDLKQPTPEMTFNHNLMRNAFNAMDLDSNSGYGTVNFPTNFLVEWYQDPPEPLSRWATEDAVFDEHNRRIFEEQVAEVAEGVSKSSTRRLAVSFEGTGPMLLSVTVTEGTPGKLGQGFLQVTPIEPAPGNNPPPPSSESGILSW